MAIVKKKIISKETITIKNVVGKKIIRIEKENLIVKKKERTGENKRIVIKKKSIVRKTKRKRRKG